MEEECVREGGTGLPHEVQGEPSHVPEMTPKVVSVMEICSPPRLTAVARELGIERLGSMELRTGWNLSSAARRKEAERIVDEENPWLASMPCHAT